MNWLGGIVVYFLIWWLVLFTVLPWGVKTGGEQVQGQASSAPRRAMIGRKLLATTAISAVLFVIVYVVIDSDLISFRQA